MRRFTLILAPTLCLLFLCVSSHAVAKENWTSVRSKNFLLVGNASEREIREVATRLEQFRVICARIFPEASLTSPVQTTVIVFKNDATYRPFKPLYQGQPTDVAGYFQAGQDLNYITLSAERHRSKNPYNIIFHEYFHLFIENNVRGLPLAINEGLAQFYSTFEVSGDGKKITLGKPLDAKPQLLLNRELLPLRTLLAVDYYSPYYNVQNKRNLFYAQSWALIHYLALGNDGRYASRLPKFFELLAAGVGPDGSFQEAFQVELETAEKELVEYVRRGVYPTSVTTFENRLQIDSSAQALRITEAEAQAHLGDLLLHSNRFDEAEKYLQQALALNPDLAMAQASYGMLRTKQKNYREAKQYLRRAIAGNPHDYRAHYFYAYALSREEMDEGQSVQGYVPEVAAIMRAELRRAIELAPDFAESYRLLAFVNLATNQQLDEAVVLLKRAIALAPGRQDSSFVLAQVYLRKRDFNAARSALQTFTRGSSPAKPDVQAEQLLASIASAEKQQQEEEMRRVNSSEGNYTPALATASTKGETSADDSTTVARPRLRKYFEGERVVGMLTQIECMDDAVILVIKIGDRILKLRSDALNRIKFLTYVRNVKGKMTCGPRQPENLVVATYRPANDQTTGTQGEAIAIEFVPEDVEIEQ